MKYLRFLNKPYRFNNNLKQNTKVIFFLSIGIILFLLLFQPININALSFEQKVYIIGGFFIINLFTLSINILILPNLFPKLFIPHKWNIKKEIIWNLWLLVNIYFGDFIIYYKYLNVIELSFYVFINLFLIAIIPITSLIVYNRNRLLRLHVESAKRIKSYQAKKTEEEIIINSNYKKDSLKIIINHLIYIKASGNYIDVYWLENNELKHQMVRTTLTQVKQELQPYSFIKQSQRSYLVNINYIDSIYSKSGEKIIKLREISVEIPLSKIFESNFSINNYNKQT
ncbi:MAG: hypothetical protein Fur0028_07970 [Bacteroidales bacterium]